MIDGLVMKSVLLLVPIVGMFLIGSWLTLRSGVVGVASEGQGSQGYRIAAENLVWMILVLVGVLGIFLALQYLVGYRVF